MERENEGLALNFQGCSSAMETVGSLLTWRWEEGGDGIYHTASETSCQKRKTEEEHEARLPSHAAATITEAVGLQTRLLDGVDHQHAQGRADPRNPVHELHMHGRAIQGAVRKGGGIDEKEETESELKISSG